MESRGAGEINTKEKLRTGIGFTLLEVMIALSIMAIGLTALLANQNQSIWIAEEGRFSLTASLLLNQKLAELEYTEEVVSQSEGDFGENYPGYFWKIELAEPDFSDAIYLMGAEQYFQLIDLTVSKVNNSRTLTARKLVMR